MDATSLVSEGAANVQVLRHQVLFTVDATRSDERYKDDASLLAAWGVIGPKSLVELSTVNGFTTPSARRSSSTTSWPVREGAHFFLSLTIFIAIYDEEWTDKHGPLSFQRDFARRLAHWEGRDYPPVGE